jgi:hypothetical protein
MRFMRRGGDRTLLSVLYPLSDAMDVVVVVDVQQPHTIVDIEQSMHGQDKH